MFYLKKVIKKTKKKFAQRTSKNKILHPPPPKKNQKNQIRSALKTSKRTNVQVFLVTREAYICFK